MYKRRILQQSRVLSGNLIRIGRASATSFESTTTTTGLAVLNSVRRHIHSYSYHHHFNNIGSFSTSNTRSDLVTTKSLSKDRIQLSVLLSPLNWNLNLNSNANLLYRTLTNMNEVTASTDTNPNTNNNSGAAIKAENNDNSSNNNQLSETSAATSTNEGNADGNKNKRKQQGHHGGKKRKSNKWAWTKKLKNKKGGNNGENGENRDVEQKEKKQYNRRNDVTWFPKELNEGSFAHPNMRKLYDVHVHIPVVAGRGQSPAAKETTVVTATSSDGKDTNNAKPEIKEEDATTQPPSHEANKDTPSATTTEGTTATTDSTTSTEVQQEERKFPKRKVALFMGFLGTKYNGMQMNKGQRTIQAEIELALYKAKLISPSNFGYPNKYSWSSSARTDKGVHSCAQVCSAKILVPTDDMDKLCDIINKELPDDIVIMDVVRSARSFVAKTARDKVRYQYMLPSFVLQDYETTNKLLESIIAPPAAGENKDIKSWKDVTNDEIQSLRESLTKYRISEDTMQKLKDTLGRFAGTHKFHNYTSRKDSQDDSARRYIHSFTVLDTVVDKNGVEWISTGVVGQSFLLHQIRKMISMAIDVTRGATAFINGSDEKDTARIDVMEESFSPKYMSINVAPAQGLFLEMSYFDHYNKRAQGGDPLDWHSNPDSLGAIRWKHFKEEKVMTHVMEEEVEQNNFIKYLFVHGLHLRQLKYKATEEKNQTTYNPNKK
jgi:tRNA pseudouridine38-40 synthase